MSRLGCLAALAVGLGACASTGAPAFGAVATCADQARERVLCHEVVVDASVTEVWTLIATSEGWRSWAAPVARVDLRVGGEIETSYDPDAEIGEPGNIHNRIVAFTPNRSLTIQIAEAPAGFPHAEEARRLTTSLEFEPRGRGALVRVTMSGFGDGEAYDALYRFFDAGNAYTLTKLASRIEADPTNWTEQRNE